MHKRGRRRGWLPGIVLLIAVGVLGTIRGSHAGGDVTWAKDYTIGSEQARRTGKLLLLSFHTAGCGWCAKLDAETFTDPQVVELSHRYVCVRLESDIDSALATHYQVIEYPMTLVVNADGKLLSRMPGYIPPDRFAAALRVLANEPK